jgi:putative salt-induced outer membrane protein
VGGAGFGVNAIKREMTVLSFIGALDYERENFINGLHRNSAEANFGDDFLHKISSTSNITQSFRIFPNLSNTGAYRVTFDLGAVTAVKKWLGWQVTASDRYVSNPVFGRQRNDLLLSTGFRLSFAK